MPTPLIYTVLAVGNVLVHSMHWQDPWMVLMYSYIQPIVCTLFILASHYGSQHWCEIYRQNAYLAALSKTSNQSYHTLYAKFKWLLMYVNNCYHMHSHSSWHTSFSLTIKHMLNSITFEDFWCILTTAYYMHTHAQSKTCTCYLPCSYYSNFLVINSLKWIKDTLKIWWDTMHVQSVFGHTYTHTHLHWMESSTWSSQSSCASSTYPLHISQSPSQGAELDPCHPSGGSGVCEESDCERCDLCFACGVDGCEWGRAWSRDRER